MANAPPIAAQELTRIVDGQPLVEDITFEVASGEVYVIFGPSGAGKSTLLRLLNRLDEPTRGTVLLDGTDYKTLDPQVVRQRVGLVPQQPTLMRGSVADNVAWGPRLRGEPIDEAALEMLLDRLGLPSFAERDADDLSGGEAQRVAIARTLFNGPEVLLLDEPASSLDAESGRRVEALLADVMETLALTAVLVTHDADQARRLGTCGLRLEAGNAVEVGSLDDVLPS